MIERSVSRSAQTSDPLFLVLSIVTTTGWVSVLAWCVWKLAASV
jgi:hypothetical protein